MDEAVRKALRRACARARTGVRKPFVLDGHKMWLSVDEHWADADAGEPNGSTRYEGYLQVGEGANVQIVSVEAMTPDCVWRTYLQSQVDAVHAT